MASRQSGVGTGVAMVGTGGNPSCRPTGESIGGSLGVLFSAKLALGSGCLGSIPLGAPTEWGQF